MALFVGALVIAACCRWEPELRLILRDTSRLDRKLANARPDTALRPRKAEFWTATAAVPSRCYSLASHRSPPWLRTYLQIGRYSAGT